MTSMKRLTKPLHAPIDVFLTCISTVDDPDLKSRYEEIAATVAIAAEAYEISAENVQLHTFPSILTVGGVSREELKRVYTLRMADKRYPGRAIYDEIIMAPAYGICPFCNEREIKQLDHHLPKANYPILSVVPSNLIPICQSCNFIKTDNSPVGQEDQTFHPYFDDFENGRWLSAQITETAPPTVIFEARQPANWDEIKFLRLANQFNNLDLKTLYTTKAATELRNIQRRLSDLHIGGGADAVRGHLLSEYESRLEADSNSWHTAAYEALANSNWYCNGGFIL